MSAYLARLSFRPYVRVADYWENTPLWKTPEERKKSPVSSLKRIRKARKKSAAKGMQAIAVRRMLQREYTSTK